MVPKQLIFFYFEGGRMPQFSNVGYTVLSTVSTIPKEWSLGPEAHFEIDYLDHDGQPRHLVVYNVSVLSSSDSGLVLGCLHDVPGYGKQKHVTFRMELRFKYSERTKKWSLIIRTFGAAPKPAAKFHWLPRVLVVWRVTLTIFAVLMILKFISHTLSPSGLAACFIWIGVGLALTHGPASLVLPKDHPEVRRYRVAGWSGYVMAALAAAATAFLNLPA